jgi:hypothetical protein
MFTPGRRCTRHLLGRDNDSLSRRAAVIATRVVRTLVEVVRNAIAVAITRRIYRAAVIRSRAWIVRTSVIHIGDAVVIIVEIGAAVGVLKAVEVFRIVGTLVAIVGNSIAIAIAATRVRRSWRMGCASACEERKRD